ncbi:adenylate/guanylate cyclase domain-containing protein [Hwanghaeella sp.]|uniref:adenylate/guanylate cyclase domain-containing protein n=1 Tax=Hwanghaeella sp. TaxID=2605943 RepID=UPI003CCBBC35
MTEAVAADRSTKSEKPKSLKFQAALAGLLIAIGSVVLTFGPKLYDREGWDIDALHWLRDTIMPAHMDPAASPTVVIAIDEATHADPELSKIPRVMWTPHIAEVQNAVMENGAAVFGWDIIYPTSAGTYVSDKRYDQALLKSLLTYGRKQGRIILGSVTFGIFDGSGKVRVFQPHIGFRRAVGSEPNIRSLLAHPDEDAGVRGIPLFLEAEDQDGKVQTDTTSMAFELAARLTGKQPSEAEDGTIRLGDQVIPHYGTRAIRLNFDTGPGAIPTFSFADLLTCARAGNTDYFKQHFAGKAVLFGIVTDIEDRKVSSNRWTNHEDFANAPAPCTEGYEYPPAAERSTTPGVYLHATAVNNIVLGNALRAVPTWLYIASILLIAGIVTAIALKFRPTKSVPLAIAVGLGWTLLVTYIFRESHTVVPLSSPLIAGVLCLGSSMVYRFFSSDKERALIHEAFKFYLDPSVIDEMIDSGSPPVLGGETREVTVLFSDIAGFSSFSENLPPEDLISFLNEYFNIFDEELRAHNGILDKYIGDAVMAIFGAPKDDPNHARNAVACCLSIQKRLAENQDVFKKFLVNLPDGTEVVTRLGVNSGDMTVGNVGGAQRANYTVFGDNVNLAARLESVNKQFGTTLLVGDVTWEQCKDDFEWRVIDRVRVVGRDTPVTLREPLGEKGSVSQEVLVQRDQFEAGLELRWSRKFDDAIGVFDALAGKGDKAAAYAGSRTREMLASPPPESWDGVLDLDKK